MRAVVAWTGLRLAAVALAVAFLVAVTSSPTAGAHARAGGDNVPAAAMAVARPAAERPDPDADPPAWPFAVGAVAAVAVVAIWSVRRRP